VRAFMDRLAASLRKERGRLAGRPE
jgi:hypothetical protein